ncbi:hypothetical protein CH302_19220 [Rhodococcus sp. 15-2388-1-1a]|uniref:hypothetical protein n=1 Tax=Nocardiaceae TaxID=85025 RepID=UPI00056CAE5D|nr:MULTISPECIES: hypothetical protein [Rhodococcus]OZE95073.1 hypothetical protein CH302_19220 [Rhodococcus sp. 15-2388-1-1a]
MSTVEDRIAAALGQHYAVSFGLCLCGWETTRTKIGESWRPEFDEHQASVIAALLANGPSGEITRRYSAAYRNPDGKVVTVGVDYRKLAWAEGVRDEWKRDDPTVNIFIAYRDVPEWQEVDPAVLDDAGVAKPSTAEQRDSDGSHIFHGDPAKCIECGVTRADHQRARAAGSGGGLVR